MGGDEVEAITIDEVRLVLQGLYIRQTYDLGETEQWIAIKSTPAKRKFSPEPHDIIKEIELLSKISHINIIDVIGSKRTGATIELYTPWIPYSLENLLDTPTFTPSPIPTQIKHLVRAAYVDAQNPSREEIFEVVTKSIVYQLIRALEYLHGLEEPVGHRDIKPRNVLIDPNGCVKLIDFGIAYQESTNADAGNLWPESKDNMYNDVATGPFRAPELLFGPKTYDACGTDLWSLGCTIAHFFTPIQLHRNLYIDDENDEDEQAWSNDDDKPRLAYLVPKDVDAVTFRSAEWARQPLFEGRRGSIGLAWSIFSLRGTPSTENWPCFEALPDANKIQFKVVPSRDIRLRLPNIPPNTPSTGSEHKAPEQFAATPLDLIHRLLVYPPEDRLKAADAVEHPWFTTTREEDVFGTDGMEWEGLELLVEYCVWESVTFTSRRMLVQWKETA
ncbi:kinase-like protein [Fomitiporia mediterranea MF3/22]|uniref:kinase-like protein n=1 Tax=Fomitiporia mediterranea (strain MF3/22) TaxID=694068 RepID=UPI0004408F25|nr:kinase-like protein [Fomitiporia mediterranea MF3/22]EJC98595.1 kinase-like protein [Fomitiporia mediterranea MF3/22]